MSMSLSVKCTCPYCFEEIFLGECGIYSGITGTVLKEPQKGPFARMRVEPLDGKHILDKAQRKCTNCGNLLPRKIELVPSLTVVVIGDYSSGKSHYITSLINQIDEWLGTFPVGNSENQTSKKRKDEFELNYSPLFTQNRMILNTPPNPYRTAEPFIYELSWSRSAQRPPTTLNLMIYDTSGEDYEDTDRLVTVARFVFNANAFIFVIDPVTIKPFVANLPVSVLSNPFMQDQLSHAQNRKAATIVKSTIALFASYHKSSGSRLSNIPVAVMVSKSDLFEQLNPRPNFQFLREPNYQPDINRSDLKAVDQEVRGLLNFYQQKELLAATGRFKRVGYFATSATGSLVDATGQFGQVKPRRCLDPFLWILSELGEI